ncbi:nuclease family of the PIN domain [Candidatus Brocadia pituitae]|nr:nuclease family of the PIN domain [Candidatus Brocadia pituitae]
MKKKYLLDSFALLAYLKEESNYEKVKNVLSSHNIHVLMNDINIGETFYILARERGIEKADYFLQVILPTLPIAHIDNTLQEVIEASRIKATYPISYADCFAVATACKEMATVITGDPEFKLVEKLVNVEWL